MDRTDWLPREELGTTPLRIPGAFLVRSDLHADPRGILHKTYTSLGMAGAPPQEVFYSRSAKGVIRGMHAPGPRNPSGKLVTVVQGTVHDTIVDLRLGPGYGQIESFPLTEASGTIVVPSGVAHGFQSLEEGTVVLYSVQATYSPSEEIGVHAMSIGVTWPLREYTLSERDRSLPSVEEFRLRGHV